MFSKHSSSVYLRPDGTGLSPTSARRSCHLPKCPVIFDHCLPRRAAICCSVTDFPGFSSMNSRSDCKTSSRLNGWNRGATVSLTPALSKALAHPPKCLSNVDELTFAKELNRSRVSRCPSIASATRRSSANRASSVYSSKVVNSNFMLSLFSSHEVFRRVPADGKGLGRRSWKSVWSLAVWAPAVGERETARPRAGRGGWPRRGFRCRGCGLW